MDTIMGVDRSTVDMGMVMVHESSFLSVPSMRLLRSSDTDMGTGPVTDPDMVMPSLASVS